MTAQGLLCRPTGKLHGSIGVVCYVAVTGDVQLDLEVCIALCMCYIRAYVWVAKSLSQTKVV